jgi:hypothetical protein
LAPGGCGLALRRCRPWPALPTRAAVGFLRRAAAPRALRTATHATCNCRTPTPAGPTPRRPAGPPV